MFNVLFLIEVPTDVNTTANKYGEVEKTVRIVSAEEVRQIESQVDTRSDIHPLPLHGTHGLSLELPASTALPCVDSQTGAKHRIELTTKS